jgi:phage shock protein PspC (stress-responsive transcriptional regulator)
MGMDEFDNLDENNGTTGPEVNAPTPPPHDTTTTLHRSTSKRVFGGVAGGIAERFDIDANIVRVVFVVLALVYGLGIALYLAMWVLIPSAPASDAVVAEPVEDTPRVRWLRYALPLAIVVLAVIFIATIHSVPNLGKAFSFVWLIFLVILAVIALFSPARRLTFRRLVALAFLGFISLLIVVSGATLLALQVIGVPVQGGSGVREWSPTTVSQVQRNYHGAFGETTVNLSRVVFSGTTSVTATQGVGELVVDVPAGLTVDLRTHVGIGTVLNFDAGYGYAGTPVAHTPGANLVLNLQLGIGKIELVHIVSNQN